MNKNTTTTYTQGPVQVHFVTPSGAPGYSHKVTVTLSGVFVARDWCANGFRPSARHAKFYAEKHGMKLEPLPN